MDEKLFSKERFKEAMGEMSVGDLASLLGCNKSNVSMYLSGQREPSRMAIRLIAIVLGVNPAWLCGLDVPKDSTVKLVHIKNAPTITGERKELIDLIPLLPDDTVHAMLLLAKQAAQI